MRKHRRASFKSNGRRFIVPVFDSSRGQSLLMTLVVLAAMVILFTILARLVLVEARVTRGYSEILRSDMAAKAGAADAENLLLQLFSNYPDSVTYWDPNIADANTPGTVFMYRDLTPDQAFAGTATTAPIIYARPLTSGSMTQEFYPKNNFDQTLPNPSNPFNPSSPYPDLTKTIDLTDKTLAIDLNVPSTFDSKDTRGWIGTLTGTTTPTSTPVPWVKILSDPTQTEDEMIDPTTHKPKNPVVARYAFWIDDESFKLNLNMVKDGTRGLANAEVKTGTINGIAATVGNPLATLQGLFDPSVITNISEAATGIVAARNALFVTGGKFLSPYQIGHTQVMPTGETGPTLGRDYKFLTTIHSAGLNLSRSGFKRLNLNDLVAQSGVVSTSNPGTAAGVQKGVGQIVAAINANSPHFGQRFYRLISSQMTATTTNRNALSVSTSPTVFSGFSDEQVYVEKLAANIFDYVSPSANPTVLDKNGNVLLGNPIVSLTDSHLNYDYTNTTTQPNPLMAIGKKAIPYFTEYVMHGKVINGTLNVPAGAVATLQIEFDHYFSFWNMTTKTIVPANGDLGPNPYLVIENQTFISSDNENFMPGYDLPQGRPIEIKLKDITDSAGNPLTFKPGSFTVITTDPQWNTGSDYGKNLNIPSSAAVYVATKLYAPDTGALIPSGDSDPPSGPSNYPTAHITQKSGTLANLREFNCATFYKNNGTDPEVQLGANWNSGSPNPPKIGPTVLMGNDDGLMEVQVGLNFHSTYGAKNLIPFHMEDVGTGQSQYFVGSYVGVVQRAENCDPRSGFEALTIGANSGCQIGAPPTNTLGNFTTGTVTGSIVNFWPSDQSKGIQDAADAPMEVAQVPIASGTTTPTGTTPGMTAIGELGNVYDPIRYDSTVSAVEQDRGGGRTLTIGQPDLVWDGTRSSISASPEWAFQTDASRNWAAWRLADIFTIRENSDMAGTAQAEISGLYNPNGILRDQGQVLQTLLQGLTFANSPDSDPTLTGTLDTSKTTTRIISAGSNMSIPSAGAGGQALASYLASRLTRGTGASPATLFSPIWEPGEISQLYMFNASNTTKQIVATASTAKLNDRGHEELCRRLMDMITTKGNTFSIYVVGQSLSPQGAVMSTKAEKVTVRLRPVFSTALNDNFDPTDSTQVAQRFRKPDSYILEVIQVEDAS